MAVTTSGAGRVPGPVIGPAAEFRPGDAPWPPGSRGLGVADGGWSRSKPIAEIDAGAFLEYCRRIIADARTPIVAGASNVHPLNFLLDTEGRLWTAVFGTGAVARVRACRAGAPDIGRGGGLLLDDADGEVDDEADGVVVAGIAVTRRALMRWEQQGLLAEGTSTAAAPGNGWEDSGEAG